MANLVIDLPKLVREENLLPLFRINDLLRLRRTCKWFKSCIDEYLVEHPRAGNTISISAKTDSLKEFAEKEENLKTSAALAGTGDPLKIPTSRFNLDLDFTPGAFDKPLVRDFLARYANQIKHLTIYQMILPLRGNELEFYEQLPNLKHLVVQILESPHEAPGEAITFPQAFRNVESFKITCFGSRLDKYADTNSYWRLIETCENLKSLAMPIERVSQFGKLTNVVNTSHQDTLKFFDIKDFLPQYGEKIRFLIPGDVMPADLKQQEYNLWEMVLTSDLKLRNFNYSLLEQFAVTPLESKVTSAIMYPNLGELIMFEYEDNVDLLVLPNVESLLLVLDPQEGEKSFKDLFFRGADASEDDRLEMIHDFILQVPLSNVFPKLTKLTMNIISLKATQVFARLWRGVPNLEELRIIHKGGLASATLTDKVFTGERGAPPFLQLTKLKKLKLIGNGKAFRTMTNDCLRRVFRLMPLREFRLVMEKPFVKITSAGIRALLNGPFGENIEIFPFKGWSLKDVSSEEFEMLGKEFKCNKF